MALGPANDALGLIWTERRIEEESAHAVITVAIVSDRWGAAAGSAPRLARSEAFRDGVGGALTGPNEHSAIGCVNMNVKGRTGESGSPGCRRLAYIAGGGAQGWH